MVAMGAGLWSGDATLWLWLAVAAGAGWLLWVVVRRRRHRPA
jgi:hypothetical protein